MKSYNICTTLNSTRPFRNFDCMIASNLKESVIEGVKNQRTTTVVEEVKQKRTIFNFR